MLRTVDFLGTNCNFYIQSQFHYSTKFGGFVTIVMGAVMCILFALFGKDFYYRINPTLLTETGNYPDYPLFVIDNSNFSLIFGIEDDSSLIWRDDSQIYIQAVFVTYEYQNDSTYVYNEVYVQPNLCEERHFFFNQSSNALRFKDHFCLDFNQTQVGGNWDSNFVYYFYLAINECSEGSSPSGSSCTSTSSSILNSNNHYMSTYMLNYNIDPNDYTQPLKYGFKNHYFLIDNSILKNYRFNIMQILVNTDYGWLFQAMNNEGALSLDSVEFDVNSNVRQNTRLANASFYFGKRFSSYLRIYTKIQVLAANVGGVMKLLFLIGSLLVRKYSLFYLNKEIITKSKGLNGEKQVKESSHYFNISNNNFVLNSLVSSSEIAKKQQSELMKKQPFEISSSNVLHKLTFHSFYLQYFLPFLRDFTYKHFNLANQSLKAILDYQACYERQFLAEESARNAHNAKLPTLQVSTKNKR